MLSDVLAWLGLEANGFGLASGGFGFQDLQARPTTVALAWLWLGLAVHMLRSVIGPGRAGELCM